MKNSLEKINNVIVDIAIKLKGNKFKNYADYENLVKKMVNDNGGDKLKEVLQSLLPLPNAKENFYKSVANKVREMVNIKFE